MMKYVHFIFDFSLLPPMLLGIFAVLTYIQTIMVAYKIEIRRYYISGFFLYATFSSKSCELFTIVRNSNSDFIMSKCGRQVFLFYHLLKMA